MAAATIKQRWTEVPDGMKTPLIISAVAHILLLVLAITGLPYFKSPPEPMTSAIPIEILPISEIRQTTRPEVKAKPAPEKPPEEKPVEQKPTPPKVEAVEPPKEIKPPKPAESKPKPKPVVPPPPDEAALEKTKEPPPPREKPQEEAAEPKKEEKKEEEPSQDFSNLLKNLNESKPQVEEDLPEAKEAEAPSPSPQAVLGQQMTMSEADALAQQLQRCWSIQAGARYAEELVVKVRLTVSPDRHATSATIVDQLRYSSDSYFRAAADAAIRAVNSPQCETLELPPDKYDMWKDIVVTFDPRDML